MARPTTGVALLEKYEGDPQSIRRMQAIIETLAGHRSVLDVCRELDICEAMFRRNRDEALQAAISALDPRKVGRKPHQITQDQERIAELEEERERLKLELSGAQVRELLLESRLATEQGEFVKKKRR